MKTTTFRKGPDAAGHFGPFGGRFIPETLMAAVAELTEAFEASRRDPAFQQEFDALCHTFIGRPTPCLLYTSPSPRD